jgi:hypothetical protein
MKNCLFLFLFLSFIGVEAQVPNIAFGQNRVQYKDFDFQYYTADHFTIYFYPGGQDLGKYVVKHAEDFYEELALKLDVKVKGKIDLIVYNTLEDLNQTNIGIYSPEQNGAGEAKLTNNKIFVYFNGSHEHLDQQLKEGIARVMGVRALSGRNRETRFYRNLPDWFNDGLSLYFSKKWDGKDESILRDGITSGRYSALYKLTPEQGVQFGHAIWHYIEERYGKTAVSNVVYLTRLNKSTEYGFQFALGLNTNELLVQWFEFYKKRYASESLQTLEMRPQDEVNFKQNKETSYYNPRVSGGGKYIAYAANTFGKVSIHLLNTETEVCKTVFKYGWKTRTLQTDQQMPLLAFTPRGDKLSVIYTKRGVNRMLHYTIEDGEKEKVRIEKFQKVSSMNYSLDGKSLVLSAIQKGQSDIYLYKLPSTTTTQITDDYFDDFDPAEVQLGDKRGIVFASNRVSDTLIKQRYETQTFDKQKDIFFFNLETNELYQVTNTPQISEHSPLPYSSGKYQFLSDKNGITNIHTGYLDTMFSHNQITYFITEKETEENTFASFPASFDFYAILDTSSYRIDSTSSIAVFKTIGFNNQLTNFRTDVEELSFEQRKNNALILSRSEGKPNLFKFILDTAINNKDFSFYNTDRTKKINDVKPASLQKKEEAQLPMIVFDNTPSAKTWRAFDFQSEFDFAASLPSLDSSLQNSPLQLPFDNAAVTDVAEEMANGTRFKQNKVRPYFVRFMVDKLITQLNNDPYITPYQPFNPANPNYTFQPVNIMFKLGITDLMEDHKIYGGLLFPALGNSGFSFKDLGYFLTYENLKKRWDKKVTFYHQSVSGTSNTTIPGSTDNLPTNQTLNYSIKTNYLETTFKYPFDVFHAVKLTLAYRNDRYIFKSEDRYSHFLNDNVVHWAIGRAEYIFDNSFVVQDNIRNGSRIRAFVEIQKDVPTKLYNVGSDKWRLPSFNNRFFSEIGIDARHYQKLYKQMILAMRVTFNTSLGNTRMMHYIGGTENNLLASIPAFGRLAGLGDNNGNAPVDPSANFVYQTIVSPVRGFVSNTRNGSSAATFNLELRVPIVSVLSRYRVRSNFLRNFQLVAFLDGGAAWTKWDVLTGNYQTFYEEYTNATTTLRIEKKKAPAVIGTGFGARVSLLGYFIKADMAWGFDSGTWSKKPAYYLGFGFDF